MVKNLPANAGDVGLIPDPGRSHVLRSNKTYTPQLLNLCSRAQELQLLKPEHPRVRASQQEKPPQCESLTLQLESSPHSLQLESSPHSLQLERGLHRYKDPAQSKINK